MDSFDDLDKALFGKNVSYKDTKSVGPAAEAKKKVMFKDFHTNDNLGDLNLSYDIADSDEDRDDYNDDDDFNSDFQESLKNKTQNITKNNKLANLFGIKSENQTEPDSSTVEKTTFISNKNLIEETQPQESSVKNSDTLGLAPSLSTFKSDDPVKQPVSKMKSLFDDDDDVISNLADRPKMSSSSQSKKSMLMEDLFGSRSKLTSGTDSNTRKSSLNIDSFPLRSNSDDLTSGQTNEGTNKAPATNTTYSLTATKESRRGRRTSAVLNDPLGLLSSSNLQLDDTFQNDNKQIETKQKTVDVLKKSENTEDLPEWLGGPKASKDQRQELEKIRSDGSSAKSMESMKKSSTDLASTIPIESAEQSALASKLLGIEFDQQATIMSLQQQEHELRTAGALAQQSERLNYLLETQRAKLGEQERQFNVLISRQLERQALLEAQMKAQQERIDNYIKTLAAQPSVVMPATMHNIRADLTNPVDEKVESESLLQKLQLEKLYLENTLDSLREKHEKEISILEDSYKRQITFLEEAMIQMEKRMQDDAESLEADYKSKVQKLKEEISESHKSHVEEKEMLKQENTRLIQDIRDHHSRSLATLEKEHIESIERITKSKESERQAFEIMRTDGTNVQNVLNKSQLIIESLEEMHKKFANRDASFVESQSVHLSNQEKNIEFLKNLLEKQKDDFMEEKQKLMGTVKNLESNIAELTREFQVQSTNFKEGEQILKSREQALLRDREIFVEQTTWERERLQAMRDSWAKEHDMQLDWLAQERQAIAAEKGKLQIINKLKIGVDEASKVELEASMRAAQEAASCANQERLRWQDKLNELETQQNELRDKEARLVQKAKELEEFTQAAIAKRDEGLRALKEAQFIEERYKQKFNQLQMQQELLTQREAKLSTEKLELARERLALRERIEKPEKDLGSKAESSLSIGKEVSASNFDAPLDSQYFKDIMDPHLILLNLDLNSMSEMPRSFPLTSSH